MDNTKIFLGNVSFETTQETLQEAFAKFGEIVEVYKPFRKGFAFITFKTAEAAQVAIDEMNGKEIDGREIVVSIARPREERSDRGGFRGGNRGDRGGYNRNRDDFRRE